jgi:putative cell wall-binding protein/uncharacterized protein YkwD
MAQSRLNVRRGLIIAALATAMASFLVATPASAVTTVGPGVDSVIRATNDYRVSQGVARLTHHTGLTDMAQRWANQMVDDVNNGMSLNTALRHNPNLSSEVAAATGGSSAWGENIAYNFSASNPYGTLVSQWINSEGHRLNMVKSNYTHIGVGVARTNSGAFFGVQVFARVGSSSPPAPGTLDVAVNASGASGSAPGCVELFRQDGASFTEVADYCVPIVSPTTTVRFSDIPPGTYTVRMYNFAPLPAVYLGGTAQPSSTVTIAAGATASVFLPVSPTVSLTGPSTAMTGSTMTFTATVNPAYSGSGQLWVRSGGGSWSNTGKTVSVVNGAGTVTAVAGSVVQEFRVSFGGANSAGVTVTPYMPTVSRIGGESRYDVAVGISAEYFPGGADVVYVATGTNFPDALSAAPAASLQGAPLLLVDTNVIPQSVRDELQRLGPDKIIIAGGPASVSDAVMAQLQMYATTVVRHSGENRYEVSNKITRDAFTSATVAYIATGATFPDALSASAAAGSVGAPVILVYGLATSLDPDTADLLQDLGVTEIRIAGGPASVHPSIATALDNLPGVTSVTRLTGDDRFIVSGATNRAAFISADTVFLASGLNFPDALSGAAVAGAIGAPLYVIPPSCVPGYVIDDIANFGATEVRIFGGPASVTPAAAALTRC